MELLSVSTVISGKMSRESKSCSSSSGFVMLRVILLSGCEHAPPCPPEHHLHFFEAVAKKDVGPLYVDMKLIQKK
jgi:hypothetical protein